MAGPCLYMKYAKTVLTCSGTALLPFILLFALFVGVLLIDSLVQQTKNQEKFDALSWRNGTQRERGTMVNDLLASDTLMGLRRHEVYALLDSMDLNSVYENDASYWIDQGGLFSSIIVMDILVIQFDSTTGLSHKVFIAEP